LVDQKVPWILFYWRTSGESGAMEIMNNVKSTNHTLEKGSLANFIASVWRKKNAFHVVLYLGLPEDEERR
jgi:hypothetical protein